MTFQQNITQPTVFLGAYVQRFSATFGLNSSPTSVEVDLVPSNNLAYDLSVGASGFDVSGALPGKFAQLTLGAFKFTGMVQSWTENYGTEGRTYNVRMVDPRSIFPNVQLILDGQGLGTGVDIGNYFNVFKYYGSPQAADCTNEGMSFSKIRDFLTTTGIINCYGQRFRLSFSSGFQDVSGATNPSGIQRWYRIQSGQTSLEQLVQQASTDLGMDYYAYVDYDTFNPTGISTIKIEHIYRLTESNSSGINTFINSATNSGVMISYRKGQELRSEPTTAITQGPPLTYWFNPQANQIQNSWGRADDGTIITTEYTDNTGRVLLDHITGSGSERLTNLISVPYITLTRSSITGVYPPTVTRIYGTRNATGYAPSELTMRAALYSQEAWETMLWKDHSVFASAIGIKSSRFREESDFLTKPTNIRDASQLSIIGSGVSDRTRVEENLIQSVYEATRETIEEHYGKSWLLTVGTSNWLASGTFDSTEMMPKIEFTTCEAAWSEPNKATPTGATLNFPVLQLSTNPNFKDSVGRTKSFLGIPDYDIGSSSFNHPIDLSVMSRDQFILDQGFKLVVPVQVQQYEKDPIRVEVIPSVPIQGIQNGSGYYDQKPYYDFLVAMGYTQTDIKDYNLMDSADDNRQYGLCPARPYTLPYNSNQYGFFIALERTELNYGGFIASGSRNGGVQIIQDSSLAPWTYANYTNYNTAGQQIATRAVATCTTIDTADITIAGLPVFNIGDALGDTANITGLSAQYGINGFTTSYNLKTFAYAANRITKLLTDKITNIYNKVNYNKKAIVDLSKKITLDPDAQKIFKPSDIRSNAIRNNKSLGPSNSSVGNSYMATIQIPADASGLYNPSNNPTRTVS